MRPEYFEVWFGCSLNPSELPEQFGVVTACNPQGEPHSPEWNQAAQERFRERLSKIANSRALQVFPVTGGSLDGSYFEPGFGIGGLSREEITRLGFELDQEAIFWIEPKGTWLVPCDGSQAMAVTDWNRRQRPSDREKD